MGDDVDEHVTPRFWSRRRRIWTAALMASALLLTAALVWLPGIGLRYGLIRGLRDLGWSQVSVSRADLSLFNGAIVIHSVAAGEDAKSMFGLDLLDVAFRWRPLFSRRVSVERLDLSGATVAVRRDGDGFVVNGLPVATGSGGGEGPGWSYDVTALTLSDSRVTFTDGPVTADIQVDKLTLEDLRSWQPDHPARFHLAGRLNNAPITLDGTATPFADQPRFAVTLVVDALDAATLADPIRRAGGGQLSGRVGGKLVIAGSTAPAAPLTADGSLSLSRAAWALDGTKAAAADLQWRDLHLGWTSGRLQASGAVTAKDLTVEDGGVTVQAGLAHLLMRGAVYDGKAGTLTWDGGLHAERHSVAIADIRLEHASLDWDGATRLDLSAKAQSFVHAEGKVETAGIRIRSGPLELNAKSASAEGVFEHARPNGMLPPLAGKMNATAQDLQISEGEMDWLRAGRLDITELHLDPGRQASLARAEAHDLLSLAKRGQDSYSWRFRAGRAVAEQASLAANGTGSVTALALHDAVIRVTQTKDGIVGLPQGGETGGDGQSLPRQHLGRLTLAGGSRIDFTDRSLSEPVRLRLEAVEAVVADLDTGRPDQDTRFSASARIGAAGLSAQGRARPFADTPGGEVTGNVRALDLPVLSPYAADTMGVHLQTGQLDADFDINARQGQLGGGMQLTLSELFVSQPDPNAPLAKRADMPVETVLDLLRGSDNRIRLSIPVRGDLSNPDFDISDAVGQAVGGALRTTVFTTLKVAFPLAGLISLVIDDAEGQRLALEPLVFAPGDAEVTAAARPKLAEVAQLMTQRPSLKLTLCGVATEAADWPVLRERRAGLLGRLQKLVGDGEQADAEAPNRERLARLAESRAQAAKSHLADEAGIDPGRLFTCRARVESGAGTPRVDMLL